MHRTQSSKKEISSGWKAATGRTCPRLASLILIQAMSSWNIVRRNCLNKTHFSLELKVLSTFPIQALSPKSLLLGTFLSNRLSQRVLQWTQACRKTQPRTSSARCWGRSRTRGRRLSSLITCFKTELRSTLGLRPTIISNLSNPRSKRTNPRTSQLRPFPNPSILTGGKYRRTRSLTPGKWPMSMSLGTWGLWVERWSNLGKFKLISFWFNLRHSSEKWYKKA